MNTSLCSAAALCLLALSSALPTPLLAKSTDVEIARFDKCGTAPRISCVVDGDTFWYAGTKIRMADINTPETSHPGCASEAALGQRATLRLIQLLNAGAFSLQTEGRDTDRYGRALRIVTRGGRSIGAVLTTEGLAERWKGKRSDWCTSS